MKIYMAPLLTEPLGEGTIFSIHQRIPLTLPNSRPIENFDPQGSKYGGKIRIPPP